MFYFCNIHSLLVNIQKKWQQPVRRLESNTKEIKYYFEYSQNFLNMLQIILVTKLCLIQIKNINIYEKSLINIFYIRKNLIFQDTFSDFSRNIIYVNCEIRGDSSPQESNLRTNMLSGQSATPSRQNTLSESQYTYTIIIISKEIFKPFFNNGN